MKLTIVCLTLVATLALVVCPARADDVKKFSINIGQTSKIGAHELKPGDYKLVLDAPKVSLVELKTGKTLDLEAKVQTLSDKSEQTEVHTQTTDGVIRIIGIRLGGTNTSVEFN